MTLDEYVSKYPLRAKTVRILLGLLVRPKSIATLSYMLGQHRDHVRRMLNELELLGFVHVCGWERSGKDNESPWRPIWSKGMGISVPRPKLTKQEARALDAAAARRRSRIKRGLQEEPKPLSQEQQTSLRDAIGW